ncbi:MAG: 50S ribosomal protein L23 [Nitrospirae bacterium]|nr:50S ribosomal protein L23 [Nitrospirota bacterium]
MNVHDVIRKPIFTEKGSMLNEALNKVLLEVAQDSNKIEIKRAVEELFKVEVKSVHTVNVRGKLKRVGRHVGTTRSWKKALVTLKPGQKLDFLEGVK